MHKAVKTAKVGFVFTIITVEFSVSQAQKAARGEPVAGYTNAPVSYIQDAQGYYMFTCMVSGIPSEEKEQSLTAYAYICTGGNWYFFESPAEADFASLYSVNYPLAAEKYGW